MVKLLYIIPHRARNSSRSKNLTITLQWLAEVKKYLGPDLQLEILVVEQDAIPQFTAMDSKYHHLFLLNRGIFNKGWAFNVAVKQYQDYDYYAFGDSDLIFPEVADFAKALMTHCCQSQTKAFRPFKECLDTAEMGLIDCQSFAQVQSQYDNKTLRLTPRKGINFAGGLVIISKLIYQLIGGWDEDFEGWGRHDDFMTYKLIKLGKCSEVIVPMSAIHLWHPITSDFSLKQEMIDLYNHLTKYTEVELRTYIDQSRDFIGQIDKYRWKVKTERDFHPPRK